MDRVSDPHVSTALALELNKKICRSKLKVNNTIFGDFYGESRVICLMTLFE